MQSRLIRQIVEVRITKRIVEAFQRGVRVASHVHSPVKHRHTTVAEHMPSAHRRYAAWTGARLLAAAEKIGPSTIALREAIMRTEPHPDQGFRFCLGILGFWAVLCCGKADKLVTIERTKCHGISLNGGIFVWFAERRRRCCHDFLTGTCR